ncbi:MAG: fibronectin type III domain-containing protein [Candidatus Riflebacteria bacterium]|nr:fibronectin type III domain-containing protein [Candidatus Riflebacteria bacterium]
MTRVKIGSRFRLTLLFAMSVYAMFLAGCGLGRGTDTVYISPVGPSPDTRPIWSTSLTEVQKAIASNVASGATWIATDTYVTLNLSQEQAKILCGLLDEPFPASVSVFTNAAVRQIATSGRIPDIRKGLSSAPSPLSQIVIPRQFSWADSNGRNWITPIRNQGPYGTCVAFAAVGAVEAVNRIVADNASLSIDLSEWDLWYNGTQGKNPAVGGWALSLAAEFLTRQGIVTEDLAPYSMIPVFANPPGNSIRYGLKSFRYLQNRDAIKQALLTGPVVGGMDVYTDFFYYKGGIYQHVTGSFVGGHAILLIGYDDDRNCWIAKNSWSPYWGEDGLFHIMYGQTRDTGYLFDVSVPAPLPTPTPTPTPVPATSPLILDLTVTGIGTSTATIVWKTDRDTDALVEYGLTSIYSTSTTLLASPTSVHLVTVASLTMNTLYHFRVRSKDSAGLEAIGSDSIFYTLDPNLPTIGSITVADITGSAASVLWTTDKETTAQVDYGRSITYGSSTPLVTNFSFDHSVLISDLAASTTWHFRVRVRDHSDREIISKDQTFATLDVQAPLISSITVKPPAPASVTITWNTDEPATTQVEYGPSTDYGLSADLGVSYVKAHLITLSKLNSASTYHFHVISSDPSGNVSVSADSTFTTADPNAPVISNIAAGNITSSTALITWTTDEPANGQVDFGIASGLASTTPLQPSFSIDHQITLTSLKSETTYRYTIRTADPSKNLATSTVQTFTTPDVTPPIITGITLKSISPASASILWTTNENSTSQVEYGTSTAFGFLTLLDETLTKTHSVGIADLTASTTWYYRVRSKDSSYNERISDTGSFNTPDPNAPVITGVQVQNMTSTSATIIWATDEDATSQVEYGLTTAYGSTSPSLAGYSKSHSVTISGLKSQTTYHIRAKSGDPSKNIGVSDDLSFQTPDVTPPTVSGVGTRLVTGASAEIYWTTDEDATSQLDYGLSSSYGYTTSIDNTLTRAHSVDIDGLISSSTWHYRIRSKDSSGNERVSTDSAFVTLDITAPVISGATATAITSSTATILWTTDEGADGSIEFGTTFVYGQLSAKVATYSKSHAITISGLKSETIYHYRVNSADSSKNTARTDDLTFQTPDVTPPVVTSVAARGTTGSSVTISWTTNEMSSSEIDYGFTTSYAVLPFKDSTMTTDHIATVTGLVSSSTYHFRVVSRDSSGNTASSSDYIFSTLDVTAPVLQSFAVSNIGSATASITWTTDEPSTSQVDYGTTTAYGMTSLLQSSSVLSHIVSLSGLTSNTLYHVCVRSVDPSGNKFVSGDYTFRTLDVTPPVVADISAVDISTGSARIIWTSDEVSTSQIEYGTSVSLLKISSLDQTLTKTHSVAISGLEFNSAYVYRVRSKDSSGNEAVSGMYSFATPNIPFFITSVGAQNLRETSVTMTWLTGKISNSQVFYGLTQALGSATAVGSDTVKSHAVNLTGLKPDTIYYYQVLSVDLSGGTAVSPIDFFTTPDLTGPVITQPAATEVGSSTAVIIWNTDENSTSQVEWGVTSSYGASSTIDTSLVSSHSALITGLNPNLTYHYRVKSLDKWGNASASSDLTFKTLDVFIFNTKATEIATDTAKITWITDGDTDSRVDYGLSTATLTLSGTADGYVSSHEVGLTGLSTNTLYYYQAVSSDTSGNIAKSPILSFTTLP